jgi:hypothetical protein
MIQDVFNRHENKYLINHHAMEQILAGLIDRMEPDPYNRAGLPYTIANLYLDTDDHALIRTSLQKPPYKEKLRIRAYGVPTQDDPVYVEIKKKVNGVVNKRRSRLTLAEACAFVNGGVLPAEKPGQNRQVLREIAWLLSVNDLKPRLYLAYDRQAWFAKDNPDLRVSFDANIRCRRSDLRLEDGDFGAMLLAEDERLMEIKTCGNIPFWLTRLLSEQRVYSRSFSKYGTEYQQLLQRGISHA